MFVPLVHPSGCSGRLYESIRSIGGEDAKSGLSAFDLPHSDACFVVCYPTETTETFCDCHVRAFAIFDDVPKSIQYENSKIAFARILGDGKRQRTLVFTELQSHYLVENWSQPTWKDNDKGKVEGLVGHVRPSSSLIISAFESFEALNDYLL